MEVNGHDKVRIDLAAANISAILIESADKLGEKWMDRFKIDGPQLNVAIAIAAGQVLAVCASNAVLLAGASKDDAIKVADRMNTKLKSIAYDALGVKP